MLVLTKICSFYMNRFKSCFLNRYVGRLALIGVCASACDRCPKVPEPYYVTCDRRTPCEEDLTCVDSFCSFECERDRDCGHDMRCYEGFCDLEGCDEK